MRILRVVLRILGGLLTALMFAALVATVALTYSARRSQDAIPSVLEHKVLTVISGSMEPAIMTGDVIIVKPLAPEDEVIEGDVITFRAKDAPNMLITHRVMGVVSVNGTPAAYVTKGDANNTEDLATVTRAQIVGIQRWRVPYYGYFSTFMRTKEGIVLMVIAPGVLLIGSEIRKIVKAVMEADAAEKKEKESADAQIPS